MKINEVLNCVNSAIEGERVVKEIPAKGHFVSTMVTDRVMGPYKEAVIDIIYVNRDKGINIPFVKSTTTERVLVDNMPAFITSAEMQALVKFITLCHEGDNWEKIVRGEYGDK